MIEFEIAIAPTKSTMVRYFQKGPKLFIKAEIDQDFIQLNDYEELIAKTVKTKTKADLQPSFYIQKIDH